MCSTANDYQIVCYAALAKQPDVLENMPGINYCRGISAIMFTTFFSPSEFFTAVFEDAFVLGKQCKELLSMLVSSPAAVQHIPAIINELRKKKLSPLIHHLYKTLAHNRHIPVRVSAVATSFVACCLHFDLSRTFDFSRTFSANIPRIFR